MIGTRFRDEQRAGAARWKQRTTTLPAAARQAAPYVGKDGRSGQVPYEFCLPAAYASHNLLPGVRQPALELFRELGIPWHAGVGDGPGNHLLSSQVQCVNALMPMVADPHRVTAAFGGVLDVAEVLEIEQGRFLTFEYIGPTDFFNESPGRPRVRGANCTSVDAAFRYRTTAGGIELALVEWKYVEDYRRPRSSEPSKDATRRRRYLSAWSDPDGPVRSDVLTFEDILDEPFYQLVRQQLLAHQLETAQVLGAEAVRVVHVHPAGNDAYQASLVRDSHRALGATVEEVWSKLLRRGDRFIALDSAAFLDPRATSPEYELRYGPGTQHEMPRPATGSPAQSVISPRGSGGRMLTRHELLQRLPSLGFSDIDPSSDRRNSISSKVVRGRYQGQRAVAVAADTKTTLGALLDVISLHLAEDTAVATKGVTTDEVSIIFASDAASFEAQDALCTLAASVVAGPQVNLLRLDPDGGLTHVPAKAIDFSDTAAYRYGGWLDLLQRVDSPPGLLTRLVAALGRDDVRAYPRLSSTSDAWSLRVEGLEVGRFNAARGVLDVGKPGKAGAESAARQLWVQAAPTRGAMNVQNDEASIRAAAAAIGAFADKWIRSRPGPGEAKQEEHALESRVVRGAAPVRLADGRALKLLRDQATLSDADGIVNWGSQFPTRWGRTSSSAARYLDALLRDGDVPWALELKAELGSGVGRYYRHAVGQAVLYRQFIRTATPLKPWFDTHGLDQTKCEAGVVLPRLAKMRAQDWIKRQGHICDVFGVELIWVDRKFAGLGRLTTD